MSQSLTLLQQKREENVMMLSDLDLILINFSLWGTTVYCTFYLTKRNLLREMKSLLRNTGIA